MTAAAAALVARAEEILAPLFVDAALAGWEANVRASVEAERLLVEAETALSDALADPELFAAVQAADADGDPLVGRRLDLLRIGMLPTQAPAELRHEILRLQARVESAFVEHRGVVGGVEVSDNEILEILGRSSDPAERREAWEASKSVGALVADDVRRLARLRNEVARGLGRRDWFALALEVQEMSDDRLRATLDACDAATAAPFRRWKDETDAGLARRFGCAVDELRPWHYADPFFQEVPIEGGVDLDPLFAGKDVVELAAATLAGMGLDAADVVARSDLYPRDSKCQHAFSLDVDRLGDVRVLANVVNNHRWADTMLHELGHAAFSTGHDRALPFLLRDAHLTLTEGVAILLGDLAGRGEWLEAVAGADTSGLGDALARARAAERLVFTRWVLVMTGFERALYADPDADLDAVWWDLVARYQLLTPPERPPVGGWAAKIHIGVAPVYYHTYLYGHLVAAQLRAALAREAGGLVGRQAAGELLAERIFAPGESVRWDVLLERATGAPLDPRHFAAELAAA